MLDEKGISERNQKLITFISGLNLGIHVIDLPEKPRFVTPDYKFLLHGFVKNFKIILMDKEFEGNVILECRVDADPEQHREKFVEWITIYEHRKIYTLMHQNLFVVGYNFHDKLQKRNQYPVFAKYFPHFYYDIEKVEELVQRFKEYELIIK